MKRVRVSRRTAVIGLTMYEVGQLIDALGAPRPPRDHFEEIFATDAAALRSRLVRLVGEMDRVAERLDAGQSIKDARRR
jgi:hypothetical protein